MLVVVEMERLEGVEDEVPHVLVHVSLHDPPVKVVDDSSSIHDFTNQILETVPGNPGIFGLKSLEQISVQDLHADVEIRLVEIVAVIN